MPIKIASNSFLKTIPKGKIENIIKYLRHNFWPLRTFTDLCDVNRQVKTWLDTVANVRIHQTTGKRPVDRLTDVSLRPLPDLLPDCRQTETLRVYNDFAIRFDGNTYTAPPWTIGKQVTLKADQTTVILFYQEKKIAVHTRCRQRNQRIETDSHRRQVKKLNRRLWLDKDINAFSSLGQEAVDYLHALAQAGQPIKKNISKLLSLKDDYGAVSVIYAIKKALVHNAIGADYIENILYLEFVKHRKDIILIGNPGVGKSFLAKSMAYAATQAAIKALFTSAMDMINHLIAADADHSLLKKLQYYQPQELLVIDEIGYLSLGSQGSNLFFQVISARHEKRSTVITTNRPFAQWGEIFDNTTVATAIADRLVYNSEVLILEGPSYRKRDK